MSCHDRYAQTNRKRLTVLAVGTVALVFFVLLDLAVGHGIFPARILEGVAISSFKGASQHSD